MRSDLVTPLSFWNKVQSEPGACWHWPGALSQQGYGVAWFRGRVIPAHRLAWAFANGPIASEVVVCHRCDARSCCNPSHLFIGTQADNIRDRDHKGRTSRGEDRWASKLTAAQVTEMRQLYGHCIATKRGGRRPGETSYSMIGLRYGVRRGTVMRILRRQGWKHLA